MSTRWKKVVSIIGISAMLAANSVGVMAEEAGGGNAAATVEENSGQPQDAASGDHSDNDRTDIPSQDTTTENPETDDGGSDSDEAGAPSGDSETDGTPGDSEAKDPSEDSETDNQPQDTTVNDGVENPGTDDESDGDETDAPSGDSETDAKPGENITDNDQSDDKPEDAILNPEDVVTDENLEDTITDEGIAVLAETGDFIPTELGWSDTKKGTIRFKMSSVSGESYNGGYYIEITKDGELQSIQESSIGVGSDGYIECPLDTRYPSYDFRYHKTNYSPGFGESGIYKYRVKAMVNNDTSEDFNKGTVSEYSSELQYTKPDVPIPQNVHWNNKVLEWDRVEGADLYVIYLLRPDRGKDSFLVQENKYDFSKVMTDETWNYIAVVCVKQKDGYYSYAYSDYSEEVLYKATDTGTEDGTGAAIPTELGWDDTRPGVVRVKHNEYVEGVTSYRLEYYVELYKDGNVYSRPIWFNFTDNEYCEFFTEYCPRYDFKKHETYETGDLKETGTYKYRLKPRESNETSDLFSQGKISEFSSEYQYTKPDEKLSIPQNVRWNSNGVLEWDAVEGADSYLIEQLKTEDGSWSILSGCSGTKYDLSRDIVDDNFTYAVVVCAKANKDKYTIYSDYSAEVTYKAGETNAGDTDSVATIVDNVNADSTPEAVSDAVTELANQYQGEDKNKLQIAMQTSDETRAQVKKLDDLYAQKANIKTKAVNIGEEVALDSSRISMVGAALNANKDASIQMNIRKPEPAKDIISNNKDYWTNKYDNAVQFSIDVTGINSPEDLAIPITITMPIPNNLDPERLVVLHQQSDGQLVSIQNKVDKEAGTVRFTITHFSEFIFAETPIAGDDNKPGTGDDDNKPGTGDDDNKPGTGDDDNKPGTGDDDNKPGTGDDDNKPGTGDDDNKPGTGDDSNKPGTGDNNNSSNEGTEPKPGTSSSSQSQSSSSDSSSASVTAPKVKAPTIGKSEGWSSLGKAVNEAIARKTDGTDAAVWVRLNDAEVIPQSALRAIAGKDVTVCFETKTGVIVNINGRLLTPNTVGEIKIISSRTKDGNTSLKIRNTVPNMEQSIAVFVKAKTGTQDRILYFVDATKELVSFRTGTAGANGYTAFEVPFVNADYIVK